MIAGSAGVYGFRAEAQAASRIEALLRAIDEPGVDLADATAGLVRLRGGFQVPR
jgi:hypothetical protein